jgi:hypothetical protein
MVSLLSKDIKHFVIRQNGSDGLEYFLADNKIPGLKPVLTLGS